MLYYGCSEVKSDDLDGAAEFVTNKLKNAEEYYLFLINQQKWIEALTANFPQEYGMLLKARYDGSNAHEPDYEKLQREWNAGLMALTKRALE